MTSLDQAFFKAFGQVKSSDQEPSQPSERELYTDLIPSVQDVESQAITIAATPQPKETNSVFEEPNPSPWSRTTASRLTTASENIDHYIEAQHPPTDAEGIGLRLASSEDFTSVPLVKKCSPPNDHSKSLPVIASSQPAIDESTGSSDDKPSRVESSPKKLPSLLKPAWEVDAYRIPEPSLRLLEELSEALDEVRIRLQDLSSTGQKLINLHSWSCEEGRTTVAIALAEFLSQSGSRVLLMDANHEHPNLAESLGLNIEFGWETFIDGEETLDECCVHSIGNEFTVLPMVENDWEIGELSFGAKLRSILDLALPSFDFILLDTAAGRPVWDNELADIVAAQLIVRDVRYTTDTDVLKLKRYLHQQSKQIVELIDNFSTPEHHHYKKTA